jgi:hypothetical protein
VIRQIETSETVRAQLQGPAQAVSPATPAAKSFASALAKADGAAKPKHKDPLDAPEGEVWRPVKGDDDYAKITEGPRAGQYINLSRGARRGETFTVEERDGNRVHVYAGENGREKVIAAAKDSGKVDGDEQKAAGAARRGDNEAWAPVKGANNYADILSGPRNGWFVNTSGGVRDGMAFHIVHRNDRTFHVYGTGKHRQEVEVNAAPKKDTERVEGSETKPGSSDSAETKPAGNTGGAAAPN